MNISKDLEKIGIIPLDKVKIEEKNYIAKSIADKLATNIKELSDCYNELYMRMFNCDMYYANGTKSLEECFIIIRITQYT